MQKTEIFQQEKQKLFEIFKDIDEGKRRLVEGLIGEAAFLTAENFALKQAMEKTGMVQFHPEKPFLQKTSEGAKQYLKNVNSYAGIVKTLNSILSKHEGEEEEELGDYE